MARSVCTDGDAPIVAAGELSSHPSRDRDMPDTSIEAPGEADARPLATCDGGDRQLPDTAGTEAGAVLLLEQSRQIARLRTEVDNLVEQIDRWNGRAMPVATVSSLSGCVTVSEAIDQQAALLASLADAVDQLSKRIKGLEDLTLTAPRKPWRQRLIELALGRDVYVPWRRRAAPQVSVIIAGNGQLAELRKTLASVVVQAESSLEVLVAGVQPADVDDLLNARPGRVHVVSDSAEPWNAMAKALQEAGDDVIGILRAGDLCEPDGIRQVAQFFLERPHVQAAYFECAIEISGWRFPSPTITHLDVYDLLGRPNPRARLFFRRSAYRMVGGLHPSMERAAEWHLWLRLARMFGLRRGIGHVVSIVDDPAPDPALDEDLEAARQAFFERFGLLGRFRCRVIQRVNRLRDVLHRPRRTVGDEPDLSKSYFPLESAPLVPGGPRCPLTHRSPQRLLFSGPDACKAGGRAYAVYAFDTGLAMVWPIGKKADSADSKSSIPSEPESDGEGGSRTLLGGGEKYDSPFRGFRGGDLLDRLVELLPCPISMPSSESIEAELLDAVIRHFPPEDRRIQFLDAACGSAELLDQVKRRTHWRTAGLVASHFETADAERGEPRFWYGRAADAAVVVPVGQQFDIIFARDAVRRAENPVGLLRRLRPILTPRGVVAFAVPNFDSRFRARFGPTWAHWDLPRHPVVLGRRAVRAVARSAGMKVVEIGSRSSVEWTAASLLRNRVGLGAKEETTTRPPSETRALSERLTGWARILWDWHGRGDYLLVVVQVTD